MNENPYGESNLGFALDVILVEPDANTTDEAHSSNSRHKNRTTCTYHVASSDFIVQFLNQPHRKDYSYSIRLQINGTETESTSLQMRLDPITGLCKFQQGQSLRPETPALQQLIRDKTILPGRNFIRYILHQHKHGQADKVLGTSEAYLYLWSVHDRIIISDVDGTVTRSDIRGVIDSILTESYNHIHEGVCQLFHDIVQQGKLKQDSKENDLQRRPSSSSSATAPGQVRMLYLSSRPMTLIHSTRKFLSTMYQSSNQLHSSEPNVKLPMGPIFLHTGNLSKVLVTELLYKSTHTFKADTLARQVVIPFIAAGKKDCVFLAGFGNKNTDYLSYRMVGLESRDIYIINKRSILTSARRVEEVQELSEETAVPEVSESIIGRSKSGTLLCFDDADSNYFHVDVTESCCALGAVEIVEDECSTTMSQEAIEDVTSTVVMSSSAIKIYTDPQVVKEYDASITASVKFIGYSDPRLKREIFQRIHSC